MQHNNKQTKYLYEMVLLLQDDFIMFQLRVKKQCCSFLLPVCLVFKIHHDFCQNRINSTELKIFREKSRVCVDADFCMSTLPWDILETQKMQFWLISYFHRDAIVF